MAEWVTALRAVTVQAAIFTADGVICEVFIIKSNETQIINSYRIKDWVVMSGLQLVF